MIKVDRKAILRGDVDIYLKEEKFCLAAGFEVGVVTHFCFQTVAIVEMNGKCYVSLPLQEYTLNGMLYETRDSFDELVAKYPPEDDKAGGNASEKKE